MQDAKDLTGIAEGITKEKDLHTVLRQVGKKICKQLFRNTEFVQDFGGVINAVKSLANVRIRFHVDEESYDIALEALYNDDYHWWYRVISDRCRLAGFEALKQAGMMTACSLRNYLTSF